MAAGLGLEPRRRGSEPRILPLDDPAKSDSCLLLYPILEYNLSHMNKTSLKKFLIANNKAGYAGGEEKKWIKEGDGSTTIPFKLGEWESHDNFFGGEPYGGRTVIFYKRKPVWIMVYYGWVTEGIQPDSVYKVLRAALMRMPENAPFRGPKRYKDGTLTYTNKWTGGIDRFSGEERITQRKKLIYKANYMGGWVDKRRGV